MTHVDILMSNLIIWGAVLLGIRLRLYFIAARAGLKFFTEPQYSKMNKALDEKEQKTWFAFVLLGLGLFYFAHRLTM